MNEGTDLETNRQENVIISLIVVLAVAFGVLIYSSLTTNPNASKLSVSFLYIILRYVLLALAPVSFLFHLARLIRSDHLLFILTSIANMAIGVTAIILYLTDKAELQWLHQCLINLLVGFLLLVVVYFPFKQDR